METLARNNFSSRKEGLKKIISTQRLKSHFCTGRERVSIVLYLSEFQLSFVKRNQLQLPSLVITVADNVTDPSLQEILCERQTGNALKACNLH